MSINSHELMKQSTKSEYIVFREKYSKQKKIFGRDDISKLCMVLVTVF
jgi:ABC-type transporter lipoprotein component MlaA